MARHTSASLCICFANLAHLLVARFRDQGDSLDVVKERSVAETSLRRPYGTEHVNPVVTGRLLKRLSRYDRAALLSLLLLVFHATLLEKLLVETLLLTVAVRLLLVRYSGLLKMLVWRLFSWA